MNKTEKALIILGRYPREGRVKTRLSKDLGNKEASKFYKSCTEHIFSEIEKLPRYIIPFLYYADIKDKKQVNIWINEKFIIVDPKFLNIEKNLKYAFEVCFKNNFKKVVCIATDVPNLSGEIILQAYDALENTDVVIGPDHSGGFYLFGIKKFYPELFTYNYKDRSKMVLEEIERIKSFNLSYFLLPQLIDVDTIEDLELISKQSLQNGIASW